VKFDLSRERLLGSVSGGFALLALVLLGTGLYGILSRVVAEQRREIGIRMALGAGREQIVNGLARRASVRIAIGLAGGAVLAGVTAKYLQPLLFGVSFESPRIVGATIAVLLAVLAVGFVAPAVHAASIDPAEAIREE
jgi:ABC-type antimicrobial peptide transport system permease subunit